jgi:hypothetical protein
MSKSVEMLEDAKARVRDAEARAFAASEARASSLSSVGMTGGSRPIPIPRNERVPVGTAVPEIVPIRREAPRAETVLAPVLARASRVPPAEAAETETFFAPLAKKKCSEPAPFVATWSARVPSGRESAWSPVAGGVNTPARRSVFVDELVGNIDKL